MEQKKLMELIKHGINQNQQPQVWAGLGAGNGAFTRALSSLLIEKSKIYAVDRDERLLQQISIDSKIELVKVNQDFNDKLPFDELLNGIMLANSLHFIQDKLPCIESLRSNLLPNGRMIIIEYDISTGNRYVPFPISFDQLKNLSLEAGFTKIVKLASVPSQYHQTMYSALLM